MLSDVNGQINVHKNTPALESYVFPRHWFPEKRLLVLDPHMPLLSNSTGFQVHGGNFYEVHGDINIHQVQADLRIENNDGGSPGVSLHGPGDGVLQTWPWRDSHSEGHLNPHPASIHAPSESGTLPTQRPQPGSPGGTYFSAENVNHIHRHGIQGIHILHRAVALEAIHDSVESFPQPRCHPETRGELLEDLWQWATATHSSGQDVCWLYGPAGAGKSAIMQSLCRRLENAGLLGGSFFFKRNHQTRGNAKVLFATLAYQLALHNPGLNLSISERVESDPSLVGASIFSQLRELIVGPCKLSGQPAPQILLIDGLDECAGLVVQQEVLRAIRAACAEESPSLRVIIASRPEPDISAIFEDPWLRFHKQVNVEQSFKDVRKYLRGEFSRIHHEHHETMWQTPKPWPSENVIQLLVSRSSGYFVYAATVIKFVDDRDFRPTHRLMALVERPTLERRDSDETPFQALDELYLQVLRSVPAPSRCLPILSAIIRFGLSPRHIEQLLELHPGDVRLALRRLHSVLRIPSEQSNSHICVYHASFSEFLLDLARSGEFCISTPQRTVPLARAILKAMSHNPPHTQTPDESVAWQLRDDGIHFVTFCTPPSADLLALFHSLNPDYFWPDYDFFGTETFWEQTVEWLKKAEPSRARENIISLWEDYSATYNYDCIFRLRVDHLLNLQPTTDALLYHNKILSESPLLHRVLQAYNICQDTCHPGFSPSLFYIRRILGISWDDMRTILRPLHSLNHHYAHLHLLLNCANTVAENQTVKRDLGRGCIALLKGLVVGELHERFWFDGLQWGRLIQLSPDYVELLQDPRGYDIVDLLHPFYDPELDFLETARFKDSIAWLKSLPTPPLDLIGVLQFRLSGLSTL